MTLGMQHRVLEYYQVCSKDNPELTLLQHQRQECTIAKNFCFWLLNCTKGNSTKGKKNDTIGNNFSHKHHK